MTESPNIKISFDVLSRAVEGAFNHIIITDINGIVFYANHAVETITGYSREELIGKKSNVWGKQMPKEFYDNMWHTLIVDKKPFEGELINKRKNGEIYYARTTISPIFTDNNEIVGFIGTEEDITKLKEVDKMKTEFVSLASHQLKTPLTSIKWYSEMLLDKDSGPLGPSQLKMVSAISESSVRMVDIVNLLLDVTKIESGKLDLNFSRFKINDLLANTLPDLLPKIKEKNLKITTSFKPDDVYICSDFKLLKQIFSNLIRPMRFINYLQEIVIIY
jgi:PAS domain S-box-containing protein